MYNFKEFKQIEEKVQELINEGERFDELKKKIKKWLETADERKLEILNQIWTQVNKDSINKPIENIVSNRGLPNKDSEDLFNIISNTSGSLDDKKELIQIIQDESKLIQPNDIVNSAGRNTFNDVISDELAKNETFQYAKNDIMKMKNAGNEARGQGETFLTLFVSDVKNAEKGDLKIGDTQLEVKASTKNSTATLRLREGVNAPNNVKAKEKLLNALQSINPRKKIKDSTYSFADTELSTWNEALEELDKKEVINLFKGELNGTNFKGFREIYPKMSDKILNRYLDKMINNDGTLNKMSRYALGGMFFDYYKEIEDFDKMLIMNVENHSFIVIENGMDILNYNNILKINNTSIWTGKEGRHASPEIGLVK